MQLYMSWYIISFFGFTFLNIFIFSSTLVLTFSYRRNLYTFYWKVIDVDIHVDYVFCWMILNSLRPRQDGRHFPDDTFKRIFRNENVRILINISLKFVPKGLINNIPALVQIMAWRRPGDKPLSEPMIVNLLTHECVIRLQWVKEVLGIVL